MAHTHSKRKNRGDWEEEVGEGKRPSVGILFQGKKEYINYWRYKTVRKKNDIESIYIFISLNRYLERLLI